MQQTEECPLLDGKRHGIWLKKIMVAEVLEQKRELFLAHIGQHIHVLYGSGQSIDGASKRTDEKRAYIQVLKTVEKWEQHFLKIGRLQGPIGSLLDLVAKQCGQFAAIFAHDKLYRPLLL
jgi:hypothetical protein